MVIMPAEGQLEACHLFALDCGARDATDTMVTLWFVGACLAFTASL
jgi:hypothetical protein